MAATQEREWIDFIGSADPASADRITRTVKSKNANQIKTEIRNYLLNSERYKDYVVEKATYKFFAQNDQYRKNNPEEPDGFAIGTIDNFMQKNENQCI